MRHPLLTEADAVPNDVGLAHGTVIITGSNMSENHFFADNRLNMVLAYAGAPVWRADDFSRMKLFTSMRVEDDISRGISTFMLNCCAFVPWWPTRSRKKPMMALVDEIFKGTNSADRIVGATAGSRG